MAQPEISASRSHRAPSALAPPHCAPLGGDPYLLTPGGEKASSGLGVNTGAARLNSLRGSYSTAGASRALSTGPARSECVGRVGRSWEPAAALHWLSATPDSPSRP